MNWISIKDSLPIENQHIIVLARNKVHKSIFKRNEFLDEEMIGAWQDVTHWIEAPLYEP